MRFTCDSCGAQYMISDEKVGPNGVKVRCKKCQHIVLVKRAAPEPAAAPPEKPTAPHPGGEAGLDDELGQAFDNMLGGAPAPDAAKAPAGGDLAATQLMSQEESERLAAPGAPAEPAARPPEPSGDWYVAIDDAQVGPLAPPAVKAKWESGDIGPDSLVWQPGLSDWKPLSSVTELAQFLAPVPRATPRPKGAVREGGAPRAAAPAPEGDGGWKPSAASALAALASEEIASLSAPSPAAAPARAPAAGGAGKGSLVDRMDLPDSGGVDPTGAIPLPIKGLETTGESELKRKSSVARSSAELRMKRSANRTLVAVSAGLFVLFAAGMAGVWWYFNRKLEPQGAPAVAAPAAQAPAPAPAPPSAVAPAPVAPPAAAPAQAAAPPVQAAAPAPAPAVQAAPAPVAATARPAKRRPEAAPVEKPARKQRVAQAEPAPEPPPRKAKASGGDPLLDFGDTESDFERELSGGGQKKRSVYVPPAVGSDLPAEVSQAQIQEGVASKMDGLQGCLEKQQAQNPDSHGTLKLRWTIGPDGGVTGVKNLSPEFNGQPITQCLVGVVKGIRFPRSRSSGQEVVFPFKF